MDKTAGTTIQKKVYSFFQNIKLNLNYKLWVGLCFAIGSHLVLGSQAVMGKYLQTVTKLPSLSLNCVSNGLVLLLLIPFQIFNIFGYQFFVKTLVIPFWTSKTSYTSIFQFTKQQFVQFFWKNSGYKYLYVELFLRRNKEVIKKCIITICGYFIFAIVLLVRSVCNLMASRFTLATYVQLILLSSPFVTTLFSASVQFIYNKFIAKFLKFNTVAQTERITFSLIFGIAFSVIGGICIVLGASSKSEDGSFSYWINFESLASNFDVYNFIGMGCACLSVFLLAVYTIIILFLTPNRQQAVATSKEEKEVEKEASVESVEVKLVQGNEETIEDAKIDIVDSIEPVQDNSVKEDGVTSTEDLLSKETPATEDYKEFSFTLEGMNIILFECVVWFCGFAVMSLGIFQEDWSIYLQLTTADILILAAYTILIFFVVDFLYIYAVALIGASLTASLMAVSLLSTLLLSSLFLGETIHNLFQIIGVILVLLSVSVFLILKGLKK